MAHREQQQFCSSVREKFPEHFTHRKVLDCGSLDINGSNRYLFEDCWYMGIDVGDGKNVDVVTTIHEFDHQDESFDTIISTECFEHDMYYAKSLNNICRLLKSGGMFLFTCATTGRREHGTARLNKWTSPLTANISGWCNYYKNLEESDIRAALDVDGIFREYEFSKKKEPKDSNDLYFWGIKK